MPIDYEKCDVLTWSWQKVLGGEAAHGMLALSPRAVQRLESHQPSWPIPKAFRLADKKKFAAGIFKGNTINTPSMLCVEDALDSLIWVENIGGLDKLIARSFTSFEFVANWIEKNTWVEFISNKKELRSNTGITFKIIEEWFTSMDENQQREVMKKITTLLSEENVAQDINGYPKAPPSFRVWGGGTVEPNDVRSLLPWIEWAYNEVKLEYNK